MRRTLIIGLAVLSLCGSAAGATRLVGIGIAKSDGRAYAWFDDGVVVGGTPIDFERYRRDNFALPSGVKPSAIVGISIAKNDHVYAWYSDGTVSHGTSSNLVAFAGPSPYTLPAGKTPADIVGIGIAGSDDHVYAWYRDSTVSAGTSKDLAAYRSPYSYALPAGFTTADLVELDIMPNDHVLAWFRDGRLTEGTSSQLDKYKAPVGYVSQHTLHRTWPRPSIQGPGVPHAMAVAADADEALELLRPRLPKRPGSHDDATFRDGQANAVSPKPVIAFDSKTGSGLDAMVAASDRFLIATDSNTISFLDRSGVELPNVPGGKATFGADKFFEGFLLDALNGSFNETNLNHHVGFSVPCASPGPPVDYRCIREAYDTRAYFDPASKHFAIVSSARHNLYLETMTHAACGYSKDTKTDALGKVHNVHVPRFADDCAITTRNLMLAISHTDDPRDGFEQYAVTDNSYADFPWMAINGDRVLVSHHGAASEPPDSKSLAPIVQVLSLHDLAAGAGHPAYFRYYPDDLDGATAVMPPTHRGDTQGLSLLLANRSGGINIFGLPDGGSPFNAPKLLKASLDLGDATSVLGATYRDRMLYLVDEICVESSSSSDCGDSEPKKGTKFRRSVHLVRVPLVRMGTLLQLSTAPNLGFLNFRFGRDALGDAAGNRVSYEDPSLAVNAHGDMLFGYTRRPFATAEPLPEARYSLWRKGDARPMRSFLLKAGRDKNRHSIDYTTVVVDPKDDNSFWAAISFADTADNFIAEIAQITP